MRHTSWSLLAKEASLGKLIFSWDSLLWGKVPLHYGHPDANYQDFRSKSCSFPGRFATQVSKRFSWCLIACSVFLFTMYAPLPRRAKAVQMPETGSERNICWRDYSTCYITIQFQLCSVARDLSKPSPCRVSFKTFWVDATCRVHLCNFLNKNGLGPVFSKAEKNNGYIFGAAKVGMSIPDLMW